LDEMKAIPAHMANRPTLVHTSHAGLPPANSYNRALGNLLAHSMTAQAVVSTIRFVEAGYSLVISLPHSPMRLLYREAPRL
jgi:hypothetical protein